MKKYFIIAVLFFLFSCASENEPKALSSLPSWYIYPKAFDKNLYGVGEGYTLAESTKSALNNLAGKLMISISSESQILLESNKYSTNEQSQQRIKEVVLEITFANYNLSNSGIFGGKIYSEVAVDKSAFVADYSQKLKDLNNKMADMFSKAQNKTILERFVDFKEVNDMSFKAGSIALILANLTQDTSFKKNVDLYNSYQKAYFELSSKLEIYIESKDAPKALLAKIVNVLNQKNLKVVKSKDLSNPNFVVMQVDTNLTEQKIYGSYISKLKVDLNLLSNQNKIIKSTSFENKGSSVISQDEAVKAAVADITDFDLL